MFQTRILRLSPEFHHSCWENHLFDENTLIEDRHNIYLLHCGFVKGKQGPSVLCNYIPSVRSPNLLTRTTEFRPKMQSCLFNDTNQGEQSYLNYIQPTFTLIFTSICQSSHCHTKSSPDCHHTRIHNTHPFNKYPRKMKCGRMTLSFH